ncbi:undecaprenyl-diphosphate phosphatase [Pedobacter sp. SYSU D00535]|uniref:undecaprenyl-diphosphate phosphatase n=1 Tax=Pedobacter sp. SYSU D00535 TaxID=2810308 RepID=UPI001A965216|nr:undecaprenyl-diphosphate phosphatase [Pedobacter sp. SYSU D00535]
MSIIEAIILAIIEGLTEFLPVSSTGHMIIASSLMGIQSNEFVKFFTVAIQLGAILSVIVLYWKRFFQTLDFYFKLFVAFIPSIIAGVLFSDKVDELLESPQTVAIALLVGGIVLVYIDKFLGDKAKIDNAEGVSYKKAFSIGLFQCLAMIPGTSRSASTIIGGMSEKLTRTTAAEFSFFLAIPTMFGATAKKLYDFYSDGYSISGDDIQVLIIGNVVAFIVALLAIRSFITFLQKKGFQIFGWYRIIVGLILLAFIFSGHSLEVM